MLTVTLTTETVVGTLLSCSCMADACVLRGETSKGSAFVSLLSRRAQYGR